MSAAQIAAVSLAVLIWLLPRPRLDVLTLDVLTLDVLAQARPRSRGGYRPGGQDLLIVLLGVAVGWLIADQVFGALVGAGVAFGVVVWGQQGQSRTDRRRSALLAAQLPGTVELMASTLRAGLPLRTAVVDVAAVMPEPTKGVLLGVQQHLAIGITEEESWRALTAEPAWNEVARDIASMVSSGVGLADIIEMHAADARDRAKAALEARARTVSVRSVLPLMACFLPSFILVGVVPIIAGVFAKGIFR